MAGGDCHSHVGRIGMPKQQIHLHPGCAKEHTLIQEVSMQSILWKPEVLHLEKKRRLSSSKCLPPKLIFNSDNYW